MRHALFVLPAALLAACGSSDSIDLENASANEVAQEMSKSTEAAFVNPGEWEQTATLLEIDAPGIPPQFAETMKQQMGQSQVHRTCLTPERTKNPKEDFFAGADKNCRYEHFKWGGGKIDMKLLCTHQQATQTMNLAGTYEPESYQMAMTVTQRPDAKHDYEDEGRCQARRGVQDEPRLG